MDGYCKARVTNAQFWAQSTRFKEVNLKKTEEKKIHGVKKLFAAA